MDKAHFAKVNVVAVEAVMRNVPLFAALLAPVITACWPAKALAAPPVYVPV